VGALVKNKALIKMKGGRTLTERAGGGKTQQQRGPSPELGRVRTSNGIGDGSLIRRKGGKKWGSIGAEKVVNFEKQGTGGVVWGVVS